MSVPLIPLVIRLLFSLIHAGGITLTLIIKNAQAPINLFWAAFTWVDVIRTKSDKAADMLIPKGHWVNPNLGWSIPLQLSIYTNKKIHFL